MILPEPQPHCALFLDFDGTLVEIAERPEAVSPGPQLAGQLVRLQEALDGALAVVTGRGLSELDDFLDSTVRVVAGHHGHELRTPDGVVHHQDIPHDALEEIRRGLKRFVAQDPRLLLEDKGRALVLHYRQAPELEDECDQIARRLVAGVGDELFILNGKMVREIKAQGPDKGDAVAILMRLEPFAGRTPIYAGDDVTDEDAFAVINEMGGMSIKVGEGDTLARYRVPTVAGLRHWLAGFEVLEPTGSAS